jgi:hypothetical protein
MKLGDPIPIRFDPATEHRLRSYADADDRPLAGIVRTAVRTHLADGYQKPPGPWSVDGQPATYGPSTVWYLRSPAHPEGGHQVNFRHTGQKVRIYPDESHSGRKRRDMITAALHELATVRYQERGMPIDPAAYLYGRLILCGLDPHQLEVVDA